MGNLFLLLNNGRCGIDICLQILICRGLDGLTVANYALTNSKVGGDDFVLKPISRTGNELLAKLCFYPGPGNTEDYSAMNCVNSLLNLSRSS
jgi:hypothetical protein